MEFDSHESAYQSYIEYGKKVEFDVRIQLKNINKKGGPVARVQYCCSRQGFRRATEGASYSFPITKIGCKAQMTCQLKKNGKFMIVSLNAYHNHELIRTPMKYMLKINRCISKIQEFHNDDAEKSGISIKQTLELMSREVGGS